MTKSLTIPQLVELCQAEARRYQQTGQSDERYCLELFRLALVEQNQEAWQALYNQYHNLVAAWVQRYSRFPQTGEETDFFINEVFARVWRFASTPETAAKLDSLAKCLSYLKMCVGSAIEDHLRNLEQDALNRATPLIEANDQSTSESEAKLEYASSAKALGSPNPGVETQVEHQLTLEELRQALWGTVKDEQERLVAEESWIYGFTPRQIYEHYPETFASTAEVSQIKKNILKRLRRKLTGEVT
jgi:RNA polymerase sigma factor (sigma-70 family)